MTDKNVTNPAVSAYNSRDVESRKELSRAVAADRETVVKQILDQATQPKTLDEWKERTSGGSDISR